MRIAVESRGCRDRYSWKPGRDTVDVDVLGETGKNQVTRGGDFRGAGIEARNFDPLFRSLAVDCDAPQEVLCTKVGGVDEELSVKTPGDAVDSERGVPSEPSRWTVSRECRVDLHDLHEAAARLLTGGIREMTAIR